MAAQIRLRDAGGVLRTVARIRLRDEVGNLRVIQRIRVRDTSNILRIVFQYLTASATPTTVVQNATTSTITTTGSSTCTATGGVAPFTFQWTDTGEFVDGVAASTPTAATTTFRRASCISGDTYLGNFYCRVTDATGAVADSGAVAVSISRT